MENSNNCIINRVLYSEILLNDITSLDMEEENE